MKRLLILSLSLIAMAACGSPTKPSDNNEVRFTSSLLPGNEVPPVTNADAGARSTRTMVLELKKDTAGTITSATGDFTFDLTGFPAGTTLTGAHIHKAAAGTNAGVLVSMGLGAGEIVLVNGAQKVTKDEIPITAADAQDMINKPGNYYFNVHTQLNTGGAIRGQLSKQ